MLVTADVEVDQRFERLGRWAGVYRATMHRFRKVVAEGYLQSLDR